VHRLSQIIVHNSSLIYLCSCQDSLLVAAKWKVKKRVCLLSLDKEMLYIVCLLSHTADLSDSLTPEYQ